MNTSSLHKIPQAIADQSYKQLALDGEIRTVREVIALHESEIDSAIAFGEFKNDAQRKAAKLQMMQENDALQANLKALQVLSEKRDKGAIELGLLRDRFSIAKLEARERIAKLESLTA
jgi:hypothetical protein